MERAQRTFLALSCTYLLSAVILQIANAKRRDVALWFATGVGGIVLSLLLKPGRPLVWLGLLVVLGPQMLSATKGDLVRKNRLLVIIDIAGLLSIVGGLALAHRALTG